MVRLTFSKILNIVGGSHGSGFIVVSTKMVYLQPCDRFYIYFITFSHLLEILYF